MIIQAGEYELRPFCEVDAISFYNLAHDDVVKSFVPYAYPRDLEEAEEIVEDYSKGDLKNDFYLLIQKDNNMIGMIIAVRTINKRLETSAFIAKDYRGKGIMTIAMNSFISYLKNNTDYEILAMNIDKENIASNRQIKKIGGVFQKVYCNNNIYHVFLK